MYICVTHVDARTGIPCTVAPMSTGPSFPNLKELHVLWADESEWPVLTDSSGVYLKAPKFYATCADDADVTVEGVLEVISEAEWTQRKRNELCKRDELYATKA